MRQYYLRHQVTRFVLLFTGRTGSSYLLGMLQFHPQIKAFGEHLEQHMDQGAEAQLKWTREVLSPPFISRYRAIGFKTKLIDILDPDGFAQTVREMGCQIIHMYRRNRVKAVVSRINSLRLHEATGQWNVFDKEDRLRSKAIIDPEQFSSFLLHKENVDSELEEFVSRLSLPTLRLDYEDLVIDKEGALQRLYDFLGVKPHQVQSKTLKNTKDDLREAISNFDELRSLYLGTPYEPMFDEVLVK